MQGQDSFQRRFVDKLGEHSRLEAGLLITIPTYNDSSIIQTTVEQVSRELENLGDARVLVADDGSTDRTFEILTALVPRYPWLVASGFTRNFGRGRLIRQMWSRASADVYVYMDSDLASDLARLPELIAAVKEGCEVATGSRYMAASQVRRPLLRYLVSRAYNLFVNAIFKEKISDHQCGFKALSRQAVKSLLPLCFDDRWFFDTELLVLGERLGLRVWELPVNWEERKWSRTSLSRLLGDTLVILPPLLRMIWRLRRMPKQTREKQVEQVACT